MLTMDRKKIAQMSCNPAIGGLAKGQMVREIDALVYEDVPYVVGWYLPSIRFLAWNRYSQPEWQLPRFQDFDNLWYTWWEDPDKVRALEDAMANDTALDPGPTENRFWLAWQKAQSE